MENINKLISLKGKTAIVTGGSRGIGLGIAYRLAEAGAKVMMASLHQDEINSALKPLVKKGWKVKGLICDVSKEESVKNLIKETVKEFGSVDILVNNAGIFPNVPMLKMSSGDFQKVLSINLEGVFSCTHFAAQQMIKQKHGGKIINITSIDALHPSMVGLAHYDASKHGVWGFTKNVALELAPHKIWVNAIAPGAIHTPGVEALMGGKAGMKKTIEAFVFAVPMKRIGEPDDIGKAALFLASDLSSYMTGEQIVVDGGKLLT